MWRTVITWFPICFVLFFFSLGNTCNVANMTWFFSIPVRQTVPGIFFSFFFNYYLYDSPVQPASRSHPRGNRKKKKLSAKGR